MKVSAAAVVEVVRNKRQSILSQHRQRGAVAVFVAIALLALLTGLMLAIETGRVYSTHRQLQKAATLAALDAARLVSGCDSVTATQAMLNTRVSNSLAANGYGSTGGGVTAVTEAGTIQTLTVNGIQQRSLLPGSISGSNAVRVTLTAPFPNQFVPLFQTGGTMRVSATATQQALGSLQVGSGVAKFSGGLVNQLLSGLIGGNVTLTAADYTGLLNTTVTANQLATALGVSVTDLSDPLKLQTMTPVLSTALNNLAGALSSTASKQVTDSLKNLAGQTTNNTPIPLGNILAPIGAVASDAPLLNLGDLVMALAEASQADSSGLKTITLNGAGPNLPGIASVKVYAKILQPAKLSGLGRPGQTQASTEQIALLLRVTGDGALTAGLVSGLTSTLNGLLGALGALLGLPVPVITFPNPLNIGVDVTVAPATAYLDRIDCPRSGVAGGQPVAGLSAQASLATIKLGTFTSGGSGAPALSTVSPWTVVDAKLDASHVCVGVSLLGLCLTYANLGKTDVQVNLNPTSVNVSPYGPVALHDVSQFTAVAPATTPPSFLANNPGSYNPQTISSPTSAGLNLGLSVTHSGSGALDAVSNLVSSVVSIVTSTLTGLLNLVNGLLVSTINPLLSALGLQLGTATTTMDLVTVGQPVIVTTALP